MSSFFLLLMSLSVPMYVWWEKMRRFSQIVFLPWVRRSFLFPPEPIVELLMSLFWISLYVGFVPVRDVLAIFVSDRQCLFSKKNMFGDIFRERSTKTKHVLVNPKVFTKTCFFTAFLQCRWGCLYSKTLFNSLTSKLLSQFRREQKLPLGRLFAS